jgi:DNA-binding beta-propeller fold protein YncE
MSERVFMGLLVLPLLCAACGDAVVIQGDTPGVISTVAGGGADWADSGSRALEVRLARPVQTIALESGALYILEKGLHRLLYVDPGGTMEIVAGNGSAGFRGDGGDAALAQLSNPSGIARDDAGNIYIADTGNHRVRKIDSAGIITTVAGSGVPGFFGDGLPATEAGLFNPADVAVDIPGRIYISDQDNNRIRMVDTDGTIQTICGTGDISYNGNAIPAIQAALYNPAGLSLGPFGDLYVAVVFHHRVRKIDTSGTITTVAGVSLAGYGGDGGPAVDAALSSPTDVFVREDGESFYIADQANQRVRLVDAEGLIYTVAGNGEAGYNGDGITATEARLNSPTGVAGDFFGNLYITDKENFRVRRVPFPMGTEGSGLHDIANILGP